MNIFSKTLLARSVAVVGLFCTILTASPSANAQAKPHSERLEYNCYAQGEDDGRGLALSGVLQMALQGSWPEATIYSASDIRGGIFNKRHVRISVWAGFNSGLNAVSLGMKIDEPENNFVHQTLSARIPSLGEIGSISMLDAGSSSSGTVCYFRRVG